jgi:hypothetical protein
VAVLVVCLQNVGRILLESFDSLACCLLQESVDRSSLPWVVEGLDGRIVPRILDGEEDLGRQLEEADIPDHFEEERDSFLKSKSRLKDWRHVCN